MTAKSPWRAPIPETGFLRCEFAARWPWSGCVRRFRCGSFDASGTLGDAQLDRLERMLQRLSERDLCRVILVHHPITAGARRTRGGG